jgi:hypothetical protein
MVARARIARARVILTGSSSALLRIAFVLRERHPASVAVRFALST